MILVDFEDLDRRCLKHGGGFGELGGQTPELVHGHARLVLGIG